MDRETQKQTAKRAWRAATVHGPFSAKTLSAGVTQERRFRKLAEMDHPSCPDAADLRDVLPRMVREDPEAAISALTDLLGLERAGLMVVRAPRAGASTADVQSEACDVTEAAAELLHVSRASARDGIVDPEERARIRSVSLRVQREAAEVAAVASAIESPQVEMGVR